MYWTRRPLKETGKGEEEGVVLDEQTESLYESLV